MEYVLPDPMPPVPEYIVGTLQNGFVQRHALLVENFHRPIFGMKKLKKEQRINIFDMVAKYKNMYQR